MILLDLETSFSVLYVDKNLLNTLPDEFWYIPNINFQKTTYGHPFKAKATYFIVTIDEAGVHSRM